MRLFLFLFFFICITVSDARGTGNIYSGDQSEYLVAGNEITFDVCNYCGDLSLFITPTFYNLTIHPEISVSCYSNGDILDLQLNSEKSFVEIISNKEIACTKECEILYHNCKSSPDYCVISTNNDVLVAYSFIAKTTCPMEQYMILGFIILGIIAFPVFFCIFPIVACYYCKNLEEEEEKEKEKEYII